MIDIIISLDSFSQDHADFSDIVQHLALSEGFTVDSLNVVVCGHQKISELNRDYLKRDYKTDVLAFDFRSDLKITEIDGEIYLDAETANERAPEFATSSDIELRRYLIHGLLHLMNYSDKTEAGQIEMRKKEDFYLSSLDLE